MAAQAAAPTSASTGRGRGGSGGGTTGSPLLRACPEVLWALGTGQCFLAGCPLATGNPAATAFARALVLTPGEWGIPGKTAEACKAALDGDAGALGRMGVGVARLLPLPRPVAPRMVTSCDELIVAAGLREAFPTGHQLKERLERAADGALLAALGPLPVSFRGEPVVIAGTAWETVAWAVLRRALYHRPKP